MDVLRHLLFQDPTTLWVLLGIGAVISGVVCARTGSRRAMTAAILFLVAAVGLGLLAWAVETDYERLLRTIDRMTRAAADGQADAFIGCISPEYRSGPFTKESLSMVVERGLAQVRAAAGPPAIRATDAGATFTVTQTYRFSPAPGCRLTVPAQYEAVTWEGVFARDPDGQWRLRSAFAIHPQRMAPEEAARYLPPVSGPGSGAP